MKGRDIEAMIRSGQKPVVTFLEGVENQETYLEPGMRGRLVAVRIEDDDLLSFTVDLAEFDAFNVTFESSNYFDEVSRPCMSAKEVGL